MRRMGLLLPKKVLRASFWPSCSYTAVLFALLGAGTATVCMSDNEEYYRQFPG